MKRRCIKAGCLILGMGMGLLWCEPCHAVLNLWISYYFQGDANYAVGEYSDAETLLARARQEHCKDKDEAWRLACNLDSIGVNEMALEDYEQAEQCLLCALELKKKHLGEASRFVPVTLNHLGDLYYVTGHADKAKGYYRQALELTEKDQLNLEVCRALNGLALIHNDAGEQVEAEELLKRAQDIHERHLRRWHPYLATVCVNLASLYTNLDRLDEAEPLFTQAERIQEKALPQEHPDVALRLSAKAAWCAKKGLLDEASALEQQATAISARFATINHKDAPEAGAPAQAAPAVTTETIPAANDQTAPATASPEPSPAS